MSIQSELTRIHNNINTSLEKIANRGVAVPENANSDSLPSLIELIPRGDNLDDVLTEQETLIAELKEVLQGKASGGGGDTMVGVWIFNEVLELHEFDYYFNFVLTNVADSPQFYNIYSMGDGTLYYFDVDDYDYSGYVLGVWVRPEWRTITITEEPTDAECIAWLKANARKATYEDGFAEGEKAILSAYIDWSVSAASNSCVVEVMSDTDYYASISVHIWEKNSGEEDYWGFVLAPYDTHSISTVEMGWPVYGGGDWRVDVSIMGFSKDGEF